MASHNVHLHGLPVDTDEQRGQFLLTAHSEVINNGSTKVEEAFRDLLETDAWRSYTYPDGTHHEWLEREFDYFVSAWLASQDDQRWETTRRNIVSRDVIVAMADHSGGAIAHGERRPLEEVRRQFPGVTIEATKVVSSAERTVALDPERRKRFLADEKKSTRGLNRPRAREWRVFFTEEVEPADAIVAKLNQDPDLAKEVLNLLRSGTRSDTKKGRKL